MNYFVRMYTIILVATSFAQLAILYVLCINFLLESNRTDFTIFTTRLIFYLSQMKLVTTKMEWMRAELVKYL